MSMVLGKKTQALVGLAAIGLLATACSSSSSSSPSSSPIPTVAPAGPRQLTIEEPNDGVEPVVQFMDAAKKTLDIAMYEFDSTYTPLVNAVKAAKDRGVKVRILISRTRLDAASDKQNAEDVAAFKKLGVEAALSSPAFGWYHEKAVVADAGQPDARALIADFNFGEDYFSTAPSQYDPAQAGTRGMAVIDTDKADIDTIARTFNEDWPPYSKWSGSTRPDLVWAPGGSKWNPQGNAIPVFTNLINSAQNRIDAYIQVFNDPSLMLQPLLDAANRGVKVRIITNSGGIAASIVPQLQSAGIQVVMAPESISSPSEYMYVHTKTVIFDFGSPNQVSFVGSENPFLNDSLYKERELGVLLQDPGSVDRTYSLFERDFGVSKAYAAPSPSPSSS